MKTVWTDRSRIETYQRCPRLRWLEYHEAGTGLQPAKKPLPLCVGGAVHVGLEMLLGWGRGSSVPPAIPITVEDDAVAAALADFATHRSALALDTTELAAMTPSGTDLTSQLTATAAELGLNADDPALRELASTQRNSAAEFDAWLYAEQSALVEAMVRAYARRRLQPLLAEFEVLEVEREGEWELASWETTEEEYPAPCERNCWIEHARAKAPWSCSCECHNRKWEPTTVSVDHVIRFMSRPDALLRSRTDNSLYLLSYKTAATWDIRKARDAEHDMQGLSEGVEVERRLNDWWHTVNADAPQHTIIRACQAKGISIPMAKYLEGLPAPPRILGIRYEYLLKGYRSEDKDLSARFGIKVWSQRSHLIRKYVATSTPSRGVAAYSIGDECWSYDYLKDDGSTSKLAWQNWRSRPVWEDGPDAVRRWINALDDSQEAMSAEDSTVGLEPRPLGWKSRAQALGYTSTHPLDDVFPPPMTIYRSDDQLRDWVEQVEAQETRVAEAVAQVDSAADEGERRHLLNVLLPMSRRACSYPTECAFTKVCYGGDDIRRDPLASGLFKARTPNHAAEKVAVGGGNGDE